MADKISQADLAARIAQETGLSQADAKNALTSLVNTVTAEVTKGNTVQMTGFATFERTQRAARTGRNPQTGETINIAASNAVKITAGSRLKSAVKGS